MHDEYRNDIAITVVGVLYQVALYLLVLSFLYPESEIAKEVVKAVRRRGVFTRRKSQLDPQMM
jgi:hypothetical protein